MTIHIYVSGLNGSDGANGLTAATAVQSTGKAALLADTYGADGKETMQIHLGRAATAAGYDAIRVRPKDIESNIYWIGDGAGQSGETGFTTLVATVASAAGTSQTQVVSTAALTIDAHKGKTIEIMSGAAIGDRRTIRNNDATTFFPVRQFTAAVAVGDTYRVIEPDVVVSLNTTAIQGDPILAEDIGQMTGNSSGFRWGIYFVNLAFTSTQTVRFCIKKSSVSLFGCEFRGSGFIVMSPSHSTVNAGIDNIDQLAGSSAEGPVFDALVTLNTSWLGWGMANFGNVNNAWQGGLLSSGHFYFVGPSVSAGFGSITRMRGGNLTGTTTPCVNATQECRLECLADQSTLPILMTNAASTGTVLASASTTRVSLQNTTLTNTAGPAINANTGTIECGSGNTGNGSTAGSQARHGGRVLWNALPTVTGTAGDITVNDGGAYFANATLAADNSSQVNSSTLSIVMRTA